MNYYNEFDPKAAAWLRELIKAGEIPQGEVDERSIRDVQPEDLRGFTQCHFFAGIGGWSYALKLAGWPEDEPVWTGSCPCQPFSASGKQLGRADERHLWPAFRRLINRARPAIVFGEQVASKLGRDWCAGVCADLETMGYAPGAADLCAAGVGAPHIRQRLFWGGWRLGHTNGEQAHTSESGQQMSGAGCSVAPRDGETISRVGEISSGGLDHATSARFTPTRSGESGEPERRECVPGLGCPERGGLADAEHAERRAEPEIHGETHGRNGFGRRGDIGNGLEHSTSDGREQRRTEPSGRSIASGCSEGGVEYSNEKGRQGQPLRLLGASHQGYWSNFDLIPCRDGKSRRIESGTFPLAHGVSGRVGLLRGYGNAIVPELAAQFIQAFCEARQMI